MNVIYCDICGKEMPEKDDRYIAGKDLCDECEAALRQLMSNDSAEKLRGLANVFASFEDLDSVKSTNEGIVVDMESTAFFKAFGAACSFKPIAGCFSGYAYHVEGNVTFSAFVYQGEYDEVKAGKESV